MRWIHPELPERDLRLAYCLNLHPGDTLAAALEGVRSITLPLRDRLAPGADFGVGLYLPAEVALALASPAGAAELDALCALVVRERLDPFTANAFPYGGFHGAGLKRDVFRPTWCEPERLAFTVAVARVLSALARARGDERRRGHLSLSTHPGRFGPFEPGELALAARHLAAAVRELARIEAEEGPRVVLAVEAEPRASAGTGPELERLLAALREEAARHVEPALLARHLGTCLDCCHAAVEFDPPARALACATADGAPLGKLQYSSALALPAPDERPAARARLLALAEPRFLHQVTGRRGAELLRVDDLPELADALDGDAGPAWRACEEWRCHFHVPVDLAELGEGLATTRAEAERILARVLAAPERWGSSALHVEIETYTWDVLPAAARGAGALVDGLEREYRHVFARLRDAGWRRAEEGARKGSADVDSPPGP